jgi:RND family efflux transporter MFP subunit
MTILFAAQTFLQSHVVRTILKVTIFVSLIAAAVYWFQYSPVHVSKFEVVSGDIAAEVMGTGTLEARTKAILSPKISGRLIEVSADQGDKVEAGRVIMRLDDIELKQQVEMAKVSIAAAKAALNRFEADKTQTAAILTLAENDHARIVTLSKSNAATVSDLEKSAEQLDVARAGISRSEAAMAEALQQVLVAESTLVYHEARLADTIVAAPFRGLIVQRFRDPGAIAVPGSPVLSLISTDELWITAWVDETEMSRIAVGQPARVVFRSEPEAEFRGEVARLGREADRETREFTVDVKVLELPKNWAVGQRAEVYIQTASKTKTALLPVTAVVWRDGVSGVFVARDQQAEWTSVKLGLTNRQQVEVIEGLTVGDTVLLVDDAARRTIDGRRVTLR